MTDEEPLITIEAQLNDEISVTIIGESAEEVIKELDKLLEKYGKKEGKGENNTT